MVMKCKRCEKETLYLRMSRFNTEMCCDRCLEKEQKHPMYKKAVEIELQHVDVGDYNFAGIGKPEDL